MQVATLSIAVDPSGVVQANTAMERMVDTGSMLEGVVKKVVAAWSSWKIVQYAKESAELAARYETLGVVMGVVGNNAGYTRARMDEYARSLQQTGISMVEARNSLAVMAQAHINLANATQLGRLAQHAAVIGNLNSSEAFQTMIHGIQSGQVEILRTIGINVNFENSYKKLSQQLGRSVADLTEFEKTQARTNAVLEKAPDLAGVYEAAMGTTGKQMLSMKRYAEDLQVKVGELFGPVLAEAVSQINDGLKTTKEWFDKNKEAVDGIRDSLASASKNAAGLVSDLLSIAGQFSKVNDEFSIGELLAGALALSVAFVRDALNNLWGVVQFIIGGVSEIVSGVLLGIAKIIEFITGMQPPAWLTKFFGDSKNMVNAGASKVGSTNALSRFYDGTPDEMDIWERSNSARLDQQRQAEEKRLATSQANRDREAADAAAKAAEEAYIAVLQHKVEVMKDEREAYVSKWDALVKGADAQIKETERIQDFIDNLDPAVAEAEKWAKVQNDIQWAQALGLITQERMNQLLDIARGKYTAAGQAAAKANEEVERHNKALQQEAARLNLKDDWQTRKDHLDTLASVRDTNGNLILTPDAYHKERVFPASVRDRVSDDR